MSSSSKKYVSCPVAAKSAPTVLIRVVAVRLARSKFLDRSEVGAHHLVRMTIVVLRPRSPRFRNLKLDCCFVHLLADSGRGCGAAEVVRLPMTSAVLLVVGSIRIGPPCCDRLSLEILIECAVSHVVDASDGDETFETARYLMGTLASG